MIHLLVVERSASQSCISQSKLLTDKSGSHQKIKKAAVPVGETNVVGLVKALCGTAS